VLKEGRVAEQGTHKELIDRGGLYSELWSAQETLFHGDGSEREVVVGDGVDDGSVEKKR